TMTLLPEPVAPAMSRWGILARSTAWARPATSRPSANVSLEPVLKSSDSRIPRRVTTLKSWFGISMPTALLPGIGASMRSVGGAGAAARVPHRARRVADGGPGGGRARPGVPRRRERGRRRHGRGHRRRAVLAPEAGLAGDVRRRPDHARASRPTAGANRAAVRGGPVASPARAVRGAGLAAHARGRAGAEPPPDRGHRPGELVEPQVERDQDAGNPEAGQQDERPDRREPRGRPLGEERPDTAAAGTDGRGRRLDHRCRAEQPAVRDHDAEKGQAPAGARRLARPPLDVP